MKLPYAIYAGHCIQTSARSGLWKCLWQAGGNIGVIINTDHGISSAARCHKFLSVLCSHRQHVCHGCHMLHYVSWLSHVALHMNFERRSRVNEIYQTIVFDFGEATSYVRCRSPHNVRATKSLMSISIAAFVAYWHAYSTIKSL